MTDSTDIKQLVDRFDKAVREHEMAGAQPVEDRPLIEAEYCAATAALLAAYTPPPSPQVPGSEPAFSDARQTVIDCIMEQAQVFASTYALVGGRFDDGSKMQQSEEEKTELRRMIDVSLGETRSRP